MAFAQQSMLHTSLEAAVTFSYDNISALLGSSRYLPRVVTSCSDIFSLSNPFMFSTSLGSPNSF